MNVWLVPETRQVPGPAWAKQTLQHQGEGCHDQGRLHGSSIRDNQISDGDQAVMAHVLTLEEYPHQPLLLQHCSPLGQGVFGCRKSTHPEWIESAPPRLLRQQTLSLTGWWQWPSRRKALPYTWFYPKPIPVSRVLLWSTHSRHCFRWKWHLRCHVRCLSRTYSLIITSGF